MRKLLAISLLALILTPLAAQGGEVGFPGVVATPTPTPECVENCVQSTTQATLSLTSLIEIVIISLSVRP